MAMFRDFLCKIKAGLVCNSLQLLYAFECFQSNNRALSVLAFSLLCMLRAYFIFAERIFYIEDTLLVPQGRITLKKEHRKSNALFWSEWRDLNSRPLDPQSSALPAAPHPVVPKLNLLSAYRLSADSPRRFLQKHSRGTSLGALVPLLVSSPRSNAFIRHRRRHFSSPSCATPGKLINNTTRKAF